MGKTVYIGDRPVGDGHPCYIVAEAGVNHNGQLDLAKPKSTEGMTMQQRNGR